VPASLGTRLGPVSFHEPWSISSFTFCITKHIPTYSILIFTLSHSQHTYSPTSSLSFRLSGLLPAVRSRAAVPSILGYGVPSVPLILSSAVMHRQPFPVVDMSSVAKHVDRTWYLFLYRLTMRHCAKQTTRKCGNDIYRVSLHSFVQHNFIDPSSCLR